MSTHTDFKVKNGLVVNTTATFLTTVTSTGTASGGIIISGGVGIAKDVWIGGTLNIVNTASATSTITGALVVTGGAGIGGSMYVGGNITVAGTINASITGVSTTATNIAGGTAGQLHYQSAPGVTAFAGPGTAGQLLVSAGASAPVYTNTASIYVQDSNVSTNIRAGTAGQLVYQSAANTTAFLGTATTGNFLQANYIGAPTWTSTGSMYVGNSAKVDTVIQTASASYYPTFVSTNNASAAAMSVYTTSSFVINPATGNVGIGTTSISNALLNLNPNLDPGTYPGGIIYATSNGVGGGTAAPQYGLYFNIKSYNNASSMTGIYSKVMQNVGGISYGVWGESYGSATNSTYGVYGKSAQTDTNGVGVAYGVYGIGTSTIGVANNGYAVGVYSLTNDYYKNINFVAESTYTGTNTQTVLQIIRNGSTIGSILSTATGILLNSAGSLTLQSNSTERMRITSAGGISFGASGTAYGTSGQVLQSNGNAAPTWVDASGVTAGTATSATTVNTIAQTASASYYPTFVSTNNATAAAMSVYTTSSFSVNPSTQVVDILGTLRLRANPINFGDLSYNTNGFIGTDAGNGLRSGSGYFYGSGSPGTGYLLVGTYGTTIQAVAIANGSTTALAVQAGTYNATLAGYTQQIFSAPGTINSTAATTFRGISTVLTDNSTVSNSVVGLYVDVTGGTNTTATRTAAVFSSNTPTSSTATGALQVVNGGVGIGGGLFVGGTVTSTNHIITGSAAVSNGGGAAQGALQVTGGVGVGGNILTTGYVYTANLQETKNNGLQIYVPYNSINTAISFYGGTGSKLVVNTAALSLAPSIAGGYSLGTAALPFGSTYVSSATISSSFISTSTTTGALTVTGGAGIGGNLNVGGNFYSAGNLNIVGVTTITNTASVSSTSTGALQVAGGVGVAGGGYFGGTVTATLFVGTFSGSILGVSTTATNIGGGSPGAIPYQSNTGTTAFVSISTAGYVLQSSGTVPSWVDIGPTVLNDISSQFDGSKTVFNLRLGQNIINTIVDSKDLEVVIGGQRLAPYIDTLTYPWLTPYDSFKGFRVKSSTSTGQIVIYNAPYRGDSAVLTLRQQTITRQKRKYPYSATSIAFGD